MRKVPDILPIEGDVDLRVGHDSAADTGIGQNKEDPDGNTYEP